MDTGALLALLSLSVAGGFDREGAAETLRLSRAFEVQEGSFHFFGREDCQEMLARRPASAFPEGCYGNDPATPYGLLLLPRGHGEADHEEHCPLFCEADRSATWRLGNGEAVVLLGLTPPECADFAFVGYLFSRFHAQGWLPGGSSGEEPAACPPGPARCELFAAVAGPLGAERLEPHRRFATPFALVLAASRAAAGAAREELRGAGVPDADVHELPLPGQELALGLDAGADVLTVLLRMAFVADGEALASYLREKPFRVLRLTLREPVEDPATDFFPRAALSAAVGGGGALRGEISLSEASQELAALQHAVIAEAGHELGFDYRIHVTELSPWLPDSGFGCIARGRPCRADWPGVLQLESHALAAGERECERLEQNLRLRGSCRTVHRAKLPLEDTDFMVVLGVNYKALGIAKHITLSVYNLQTLEGTKALEEPELNGTALLYADPRRASRAKYLYAYTFMRRCPTSGRRARSCYSVPASGPGAVPLGAPLHFAAWAFGVGSLGGLPRPRVVHFAAAGDSSQRKGGAEAAGRAQEAASKLEM